MMSLRCLLILAVLFVPISPQTLLADPGVAGPPLEVEHLFFDQWPTGIAVSSTGRKFSNYPPGLDPDNTNDGANGKYTVAELTFNNTETPFPNAEMNNPPSGAINYTTNPPTGANYQDFLIGVQSVVIDAKDRLWILDTGRALTSDGVLVPATYGGPKLVGVNLTNNSVFQTILFPPEVAYPDSYVNDVRFDLRPEVSQSGQGIAYITDSSVEGRNGIIIVDIGSGQSWRHLNGAASVRPEEGFLPFVQGIPMYYMDSPSRQPTHIPVGSDGIALSADGNDLFWGPLGARYLYSAPTAKLRERGNTSEVEVESSVQNHGQKGFSDGFETDTNNFIYFGNMEQNAVSLYNPANATVSILVRDPRINWVDTLSVSTDGYLYFTVNQIHLSPGFLPGTDRRVKPYALFKVPLPDGGSKVLLQ